MRKALKLSTEKLHDLLPAELAAVAAAENGTITFEHLACHPSLRLECSVIDCIRTR